MNNICIDPDYSQLYKDGQQIGGDVFLLNMKSGGISKITATLSDGLGSGVKANVMASLTAHMAEKLSFSPLELVHSAEIMMDTLPVDKDKGISYATFTIAQISFTPNKDNIEVNLVEYDNPVALRFMGSEPIEWERTAHVLNRKNATKEEVVYSSHFNMTFGERLIFFSDGVAQAGVSLGGAAGPAEISRAGGSGTYSGTLPGGTGTSRVGINSTGSRFSISSMYGSSSGSSASRPHPSSAIILEPKEKPTENDEPAAEAEAENAENKTPEPAGGAAIKNPVLHNPKVDSKGWGVENVQKFIIDSIKADPDVSARDLSRAIVTQAYSYDNYHCNDDTTCVVIGVRRPRRTLLVTGAPREKEMDKELGDIVRNYNGNIIICGGTTAKIVARELGTQVKPDKSPHGALPPQSKIEGIDLVTEGMLTLSEVTARLQDKVLLKHMPEDPAKRFIRIMRETDQLDIVVGTKINEEATASGLTANIGIRLPLIERLKKALIDNYLKEVEIHYL